MKKLSNILFVELSKEERMNLLKEVKETIAFALVEPRKRIFTAADLWNIQRQGKARVQRRYL